MRTEIEIIVNKQTMTRFSYIHHYHYYDIEINTNLYKYYYNCFNVVEGRSLISVVTENHEE